MKPILEDVTGYPSGLLVIILNNILIFLKVFEFFTFL